MTPAGLLSTVSRGSWRFVLFAAPTLDNVLMYRDLLRDAGVKHVVRACESTYPADVFAKSGIQVHELNFSDGTSPDSSMLEKWRNILHLVEKEASVTSSPGADPIKVIGVHCVAGLGRSPTLVAVALMDMHNMNSADAIDLIRAQRRGALNSKQLEFLFRYKPVKKGILTSIKAFLKRNTSAPSLSTMGRTSGGSSSSKGEGRGAAAAGGGGNDSGSDGDSVLSSPPRLAARSLTE